MTVWSSANTTPSNAWILTLLLSCTSANPFLSRNLDFTLTLTLFGLRISRILLSSMPTGAFASERFCYIYGSVSRKTSVNDKNLKFTIYDSLERLGFHNLFLKFWAKYLIYLQRYTSNIPTTYVICLCDVLNVIQTLNDVNEMTI